MQRAADRMRPLEQIHEHLSALTPEAGRSAPEKHPPESS